MKPLNNFGRALQVPAFSRMARPLPPALYDEREDITDRLTVGIVAKKAKPLFDNSRIMHGSRTVEDDQRLILTRFGKTTF